MNMGEYILPKLNIYGIPIANKYLEGKLKNTLVRGWNRVWIFMDFNANKIKLKINYKILKNFLNRKKRVYLNLSMG